MTDIASKLRGYCFNDAMKKPLFSIPLDPQNPYSSSGLQASAQSLMLEAANEVERILAENDRLRAELAEARDKALDEAATALTKAARQYDDDNYTGDLVDRDIAKAKGLVLRKNADEILALKENGGK